MSQHPIEPDCPHSLHLLVDDTAHGEGIHLDMDADLSAIGQVQLLNEVITALARVRLDVIRSHALTN